MRSIRCNLLVNLRLLKGVADPDQKGSVIAENTRGPHRRSKVQNVNVSTVDICLSDCGHVVFRTSAQVEESSSSGQRSSILFRSSSGSDIERSESENSVSLILFAPKPGQSAANSSSQ